MLEKQIERYLREKVKKIGGVAYKFTSPQRRSVPDRLCLFKNGDVVFVEVKAPGKKPTPNQSREIQRLIDLGFKALVIDTREKVDSLIEEVSNDKKNSCKPTQH